MAWHFPEGASGGLFDTYLLLANPGTNDSTVRLTLFIEGVGRFTAFQPELLRTVRAGSRVTIYMNEFLSALETAEVSSGRQPARQVVQHQDRGAERRPGGRGRGALLAAGTASTSGAAARPRSAFRSSRHPAAAQGAAAVPVPPHDFPILLILLQPID